MQDVLVASNGKEERAFDVLEGDWQGNLGSKMLACLDSSTNNTFWKGWLHLSVSNTPFLQDPFRAAWLTAMSDLIWKGKQKPAEEFHY